MLAKLQRRSFSQALISYVSHIYLRRELLQTCSHAVEDLLLIINCLLDPRDTSEALACFRSNPRFPSLATSGFPIKTLRLHRHTGDHQVKWTACTCDPTHAFSKLFFSHRITLCQNSDDISPQQRLRWREHHLKPTTCFATFNSLTSCRHETPYYGKVGSFGLTQVFLKFLPLHR